MSRTRFEASLDKKRNMKECEEAGIVADSEDVRLALMKKVWLGKCTLEEVQAELKAIKRNAKKNGLITRTQAFNRG